MNNRVHIIAEMACSHDGDPALGRIIIDGAGAAGADSVQFQIWSVDRMVVPHHADIPLLKRIELSPQTWKDLAAYSRDRYPNMQIIACVYERSSVDVAEELGVDAYKIHSADLSNPGLIEYVANTGKRIDLSVGASTVVEIQTAVEWIRSAGNDKVWLMYGYQGFPTPTNAINLAYMMKLKHMFEFPIGYQDHSAGDSDSAFWLPAAAVGLGVDILEKHITHNRALKGIDHEAALNPDEFGRFVAMVRELEAARGVSRPQPFSEQETKYRKYSKKSIVATTDLAEGKVIGPEDLVAMRSDILGLPPDQAPALIGKQLKEPIKAYHVITLDHIS